ncbi:hypothetical protein AVEN_236979-1, partial [Araneus ventricosus]
RSDLIKAHPLKNFVASKQEGAEMKLFEETFDLILEPFQTPQDLNFRL